MTFLGSPSRSDRLTPQKLSTSCRSELVAISARPSGFRPGRGHDSPCFHRMRLFTKALLLSVKEEWLPTSRAQDGEGNGLARILVPRNLRISMLPYPVRGNKNPIRYSGAKQETGRHPPFVDTSRRYQGFSHV